MKKISHRAAPLWLAGGLIGIMTCPSSLVAAGLNEGSSEDNRESASSHTPFSSSDRFRSLIVEALHHARVADAAGSRGDSRGLTRHSQKALEKAKEGQRVGHNERLNEGVYALGEAIAHGRKDQTVDANQHVKYAIMKLSQSAGLQLPEGAPIGEKAGPTGG